MHRWLLSALAGFLVATPSLANCTLHQVTTVVCSLGDCETTVHSVWICGGGGGSGGGVPPGGGGSGGSTVNPSDTNNDGYLDDWEDVITTTDPCAENFDLNDRLGSNHGGPNTTRPDHLGVDIQADNGDAVYSMGDGDVYAVGWQNENNHQGGCGFWVRIEHPDGSRATYCHLNEDDQNPEVGDSVQAGDQIGTADNTGNSTGDHLHLVYADDNGNREEFFDHTGNSPTTNELDPNGC